MHVSFYIYIVNKGFFTFSGLQQFHLVQFTNQIFFSALVASSERKINISKNLKDETVFCSSKQAMYTVAYLFNI